MSKNSKISQDLNPGVSDSKFLSFPRLSYTVEKTPFFFLWLSGLNTIVNLLHPKHLDTHKDKLDSCCFGKK